MRELMEEVVRKGSELGADFCDLRIVNHSGTLIRIEDGLAKELLSPHDFGACIRVLFRGRWGVASTNAINKTELLSTLEDAIAAAKASSGEITPIVEVPPFEGEAIIEVEIDPRGVSEGKKISLLMRLERDARLESDKIANTVLGYSDSVMREMVCNSYGVFTDQTLIRTRAAILVTAKDGENRQSAFESVGRLGGFEVIEGLDSEKFGVKAARTATRLLKAEKAPAGRFTVIMDPGIAGLFAHEALGHNAEGDLVAHHTSIIEGMIGEKIASEAVTLVDDATIPGLHGSYFFDSEGTPAAKRVIIEKGVLKCYMHSLETAARLDAEPNGSCRAFLHQNHPIVRMSNTFFAPGEHTLEELMEDIELGLLVKGRNWGYVFVERGQFTCNIEEAWMIRKGELAEQVIGVSIGGLTLETLKNVEGCSKELVFDLPGICGKGQPMWVDAGGPYIRVRDVVVGGYK
jgi:TldD protein